MTTYFNLSEIATVEELKKAYRALCLTMHPDKGGNTEDFQEMQNQYEDAAAILSGETPRARRATTTPRRDAVAVRRGMSVIFFGAGMMETNYIVLSVNDDVIELLRVFGGDFQSLEDVEYFDEESDRTSRHTCNRYSYIEPLSKKFGIGFYYDDVTGKTYTEEEIREAERVADNFDKWIEIKKQKEEEDKRRAQEEADRAEAAIIAEWRDILEELPPLHKLTPWEDVQKMTREERKAVIDADRKAERRANAQRLAAFKRNIKAVFNHYFPGVKVSVSDTSKCWCESSVISWIDGPTVDEVKAVAAFDYFRACGWVGPNPYEDYGHRETRRTLQKFREMFGAWSDDSIKYERTFSDETGAKVDALIASIIPDFAGKKFNDKIETTDEQATEIIKLFGFDFSEPWRADMTEEESRDHYARQREHEEERDRIRRVIAPSCQQWRGDCYYQSIIAIFTDYYKMPESTTEPTTTTERPQTEGAQCGDEITEAEAVAAILAAEQAGTITRENVGNWWGFSGRGTFGLKKAFRALGGTWDKVGKCWGVEKKYFEPTTEEPTAEEPTADQNTTTEEPTAEAETTEPQQEETTAEERDPLAEELAEALRKVEEIRARMAEREALRKAEEERKAREAERAAAIAAAREEMAAAEAAEAQAREALENAERVAREAMEATKAAAERLAALQAEDITEEPANPSDLEGVAEFADMARRENVRQYFAKAAKVADEFTEENQHDAAAREMVSAFYVMSEKLELEAKRHLEILGQIKEAHDERGHILPEEMERRTCSLYRCAFLCVEEFGEELARVLFGSYVDGLTRHPEATSAAA